MYLEKYPWPGNVRQLESIIIRLIIVSPKDTITVYNLPDNIINYSDNLHAGISSTIDDTIKILLDNISLSSSDPILPKIEGSIIKKIVKIKILEAAIAKKVDASRISFIYTVRAVVAFAPALVTGSPKRLKRVYDAMLCEVAMHLVPARPGRLEPRRLAHDPRSYPKLQTTRAKWRKQNAA
jgi:hypothetical protein